MKHQGFELITKDGLHLFGRRFEPDGEVKAVVCLIHGGQEHSGRYLFVAQTLTDAGYAVVTMDLRGHGKSQGKAGHTPSYEVYMDDIEGLLDEAARQCPRKPLFLYGHSLGGNLVLNFPLRKSYPLKGLVVTSPLLRLGFIPPPWKIISGRIMNHMWPSFSLPAGIDPNNLSHDKMVVKAYREDPLVQDWISARRFFTVSEAGEYAIEHASELKIPLLLMHGSDDHIAAPRATEALASQVTGDCTLKIWDGLYHELHNEPQKQQVLKVIVQWLDAHH